ncbi:hypothetical protein [Jiella sp. M17.18]|uniref:hypothetical protein n=1 Tax=Jiella sp. M17.18 TaxID=3234247 RepID=UPI0034DF51FA
MIPLAQYLTEFEDKQKAPFQGSQRPPKAKKARPAPFEHLTLVADRETPREDAPNLRSASAIPQMAVDGEALAFDSSDLSGDGTLDLSPEDGDGGFGALTEEDLDAAREAGREEGREEGREAALAEGAEETRRAVAEAVAAERARAAKEQAEAIEAARAEWLAGDGERLGRTVADRLDRIESAVRISFASVLKPLALDARKRQTMLELAGAVGSLALDGEALSLHATGPSDLVEAFKTALEGRSAFVTFEVDEAACDVRITCDQTTLETRLAGWRTALEEALS